MADDIELGPIDWLVVEFPPEYRTGEGLPYLVDLVDRGIIRILDLVWIKKLDDGSVAVVEIEEIDGALDLDLSIFEGARSGVLGDDDISEAGQTVAPGAAAGILLYENRWAAPFATALRRGGAQLVSSGRIPVNALVSALDELEA
jgi:hypothetical protein